YHTTYTLYVSLYFLLLPPPPTSTLFPYTTLFRSYRCEPSSRSSRRGQARDVKRRLHRSGRTIGRGSGGWNALPRRRFRGRTRVRSEEHTSELQSLAYLVCRLLLEKKKKSQYTYIN